MSGGTLYTSAKRPGGQIIGGTLCTTTPQQHKTRKGYEFVIRGRSLPVRPVAEVLHDKRYVQLQACAFVMSVI